mgnify:CR=1 FL=1
MTPQSNIELVGDAYAAFGSGRSPKAPEAFEPLHFIASEDRVVAPGRRAFPCQVDRPDVGMRMGARFHRA